MKHIVKFRETKVKATKKQCGFTICYMNIIVVNNKFVKEKNRVCETFREIIMYKLYKNERIDSYKTAKNTK